MDHLKETASVAARLYVRAGTESQRETCGELLRAVTQADRWLRDDVSQSRAPLTLVRHLVLATVGGAWVREHAGSACVTSLRSQDLTGGLPGDATRAFDSSCAEVLRERFPEAVAQAL